MSHETLIGTGVKKLYILIFFFVDKLIINRQIYKYNIVDYRPAMLHLTIAGILTALLTIYFQMIYRFPQFYCSHRFQQLALVF